MGAQALVRCLVRRNQLSRQRSHGFEAVARIPVVSTRSRAIRSGYGNHPQARDRMAVERRVGPILGSSPLWSIPERNPPRFAWHDDFVRVSSGLAAVSCARACRPRRPLEIGPMQRDRDECETPPSREGGGVSSNQLKPTLRGPSQFRCGTSSRPTSRSLTAISSRRSSHARPRRRARSRRLSGDVATHDDPGGATDPSKATPTDRSRSTAAPGSSTTNVSRSCAPTRTALGETRKDAGDLVAGWQYRTLEDARVVR